MKITAIQNCGTCHPQKNLKLAHPNYKTGLLDGDSPADTVCFRGKNTVKGGFWGAVTGVACLAAISLLSGGLAAPAAFGLYGATMGAAGGAVGHALDQIEEEEKERNKKNGG